MKNINLLIVIKELDYLVIKIIIKFIKDFFPFLLNKNIYMGNKKNFIITYYKRIQN